jgi:hypothetical protein
VVPALALLSLGPPFPFYSEAPARRVVEGVHLSADVDTTSSLAAPRWLDGFRLYDDAMFHPNLAMVIDVSLKP